MKSETICITCTREQSLRQRLDGFLVERYPVTGASDVEAVRMALRQHFTCVLLLDLRMPSALELLQALPSIRPTCVPICFAEPRSRPALNAEQLGVREMQPLEPQRAELQAAVYRAAELSQLRADNLLLQQRSPTAEAPRGASGRGPLAPASEVALRELSRAALLLESPDELLQRLIEAAAGQIMCSRMGLYLIDSARGVFTFRAGVRCLGGEAMRAIPTTAAVAEQARVRGHVITRDALHRIGERSDRLLVADYLDEVGAETLVPLLGKEGLLGWLFVGATATGETWRESDIERLLLLAQEISRPIERMESYRRTGLRKRLLEKLFEALPIGVFAVNGDCEVMWLNREAERLLEVTPDSSMGMQIDLFGVAMSNLVRDQQMERMPQRRVLRSRSGVPLEVRTEVITAESNEEDGVLVILQDVSASERLLEEQQHSVRQDILAEMAASMAFEIRSPLAAIKTFTQLLPERSHDASFTQRYSEIVGAEVERLSELGNSISALADLRGRESASNEVFSVAKLMDLVRCLYGPDWKDVKTDIDAATTNVEGNSARLAECICHLLANARDAAHSTIIPTIKLTIQPRRISKNINALSICVSDSRPVEKVGPFIDNTFLGSDEVHKRADLRLTFASQIVREFAGDLDLATSEEGVTVTVLLPICQQ